MLQKTLWKILFYSCVTWKETGCLHWYCIALFGENPNWNLNLPAWSAVLAFPFSYSKHLHCLHHLNLNPQYIKSFCFTLSSPTLSENPPADHCISCFSPVVEHIRRRYSQKSEDQGKELTHLLFSKHTFQMTKSYSPPVSDLFFSPTGQSLCPNTSTARS